MGYDADSGEGDGGVRGTNVSGGSGVNVANLICWL